MIDMREMINARMVTLLGEVAGVKQVYRNRGQLPPGEQAPAIVYLDGTERLRSDLRGKNFTSMPAAVFTMRPQVFLVLELRTDVDNTVLADETVSPVGVELSAKRVAIVNAVLTDDSLVALVDDTGSIVYEGMDTDMQSGSTIGSLGATMQFHFAISYVLDPSDLS